MNIIYQADQIANGSAIVGDTYRRGAYAEWFVTNAPRERWPSAGDTLESQAAYIVRKDAENKQSNDGLPPGPWHFYHSSEPVEVNDSKLNQVCTMPVSVFANHRVGEHIGKYIARCGSPAVRKIMHRLTDDQLSVLSKCLDMKSATIDIDNIGQDGFSFTSVRVETR